jgi:hypothetical protein
MVGHGPSVSPRKARCGPAPAEPRVYRRWVDERLRRALALVFGDRLFALAQRCLLDARLPERTRLLSRLLDCALDTGYGELADVLFGAGCLSGVQRRGYRAHVRA